MKVLNERDQFLSNFEVLEHLNGLKSKYHWTFTPEEEEALAKKHQNSKYKHPKRFTHCGLGLEVITRDVTAYINKGNEITSKEGFKQLMLHLNTLDLMKIEKLQIVNSLPRSMVHLYALIEECDSRFEQDVCEEVLTKINELFPVEEEEEEEEGEEEGEEEAGEAAEQEEGEPQEGHEGNAQAE